MPYKVSWYQENAIVLLEYKGEVTVENVIQAQEQLLEYYLKPAQHTLHILTDATTLTEVAFPFQEVSTHYVVVAAANHPLLGKTVYCNKRNPLYDLMRQYGMEDNFFHTRADAAAFLAGVEG